MTSLVTLLVADCSILSSRVILLLDDLLWVLTVTQLKAAILYANSLKEVIERSAQQSKRLAAEKLKVMCSASYDGRDSFLVWAVCRVPTVMTVTIEDICKVPTPRLIVPNKRNTHNGHRDGECYL